MAKAAVEGLGFRRGAANTVEETRGGQFVYSGSASQYYEWEFRTELSMLTIKDEADRKVVMAKIVQALRGEAMIIARDIGLGVLMDPKQGWNSLQEAVKAHVFPSQHAEAKELFQSGSKPGIMSVMHRRA
jgi:hypothetical protein